MNASSMPARSMPARLDLELYLAEQRAPPHLSFACGLAAAVPEGEAGVAIPYRQGACRRPWDQRSGCNAMSLDVASRVYELNSAAR